MRAKAKAKNKVLIIRFEMWAVDYHEARLFYSDTEIRRILREDGENQLRNVVALRAADSAEARIIAEYHSFYKKGGAK